MSVYLVKFFQNERLLTVEIKAKSYADAVTDFPDWFEITKKNP
jgi:hypothetical protein